jgi:hypothetical protein
MGTRSTTDDTTASRDLNSAWGDVYEVTVTDGNWSALCRETLEILDADSAGELQRKMQDYYA